MRKNLLKTVTSVDMPSSETRSRSEYARQGASKSMRLSIDELAENARRLVEGEAIVSLDPNKIDPSFLRDRLEDDDLDFESFKEGVRAQGQLQPILVRRHPSEPDRHMIVFGHRRTRACRELGIPVQAVVKELEEIAHVVAQGQENSRRSNLTFIERALLARKLLEMGQSKETIVEALTVDETLLSRMLSIVETIPSRLVEAIGSARGVGRDRWETLKKLLANPRKAEAAMKRAESDDFRSLDSAARFDQLLAAATKGPGRPGVAKPIAKAIESSSGGKLGELRTSKFEVSLRLAQPAGLAFGTFLESRLPALFEEFNKAGN